MVINRIIVFHFRTTEQLVSLPELCGNCQLKEHLTLFFWKRLYVMYGRRNKCLDRLLASLYFLVNIWASLHLRIYDTCLSANTLIF